MTYTTDTTTDTGVATLEREEPDVVSEGLDDELDGLGEDDQDYDDEGDDVAEEAAGAQPGTVRRTGPNKAAVRRVGTKLVQLQDADADDLAVLASLYGVEADPLEVTVAVMTTDRSALTAVKDLTDIAEADDAFDAMVVAQAKGRARMKGVHSLLVALGGAKSASLNGNDAKAGAALAKDVTRLDDSAKQSLDRVLELARRTA